jgi:hypothetical protein
MEMRKVIGYAVIAGFGLLAMLGWSGTAYAPLVCTCYSQGGVQPLTQSDKQGGKYYYPRTGGQSISYGGGGGSYGEYSPNGSDPTHK